MYVYCHAFPLTGYFLTLFVIYRYRKVYTFTWSYFFLFFFHQSRSKEAVLIPGIKGWAVSHFPFYPERCNRHLQKYSIQTDLQKASSTNSAGSDFFRFSTKSVLFSAKFLPLPYAYLEKASDSTITKRLRVREELPSLPFFC